MVEVEHFGGFGWKMVTGRKRSFQIPDCGSTLVFEMRSGYSLTFQFGGSVGAEELRACMHGYVKRRCGFAHHMMLPLLVGVT